MKRQERNTLYSLKRDVTDKTINIDIPLSYTREGKQAIHDLLVIEKGFTAKRIEWNNIILEYCIAYSKSYDEQERKEQKTEQIENIIKTLRTSDYTWNGYKKA